MLVTERDERRRSLDLVQRMGEEARDGALERRDRTARTQSRERLAGRRDRLLAAQPVEQRVDDVLGRPFGLDELGERGGDSESVGAGFASAIARCLKMVCVVRSVTGANDSDGP